MKALITGICGFVGSTLARALAESSTFDEIIGVDNFSRPGSELNRRPLQAAGIHVLAGDIRNPSDVDSLPPTNWVIDCAANPSVLAGVDGKTSSRQLVEHNLSGTVNVLEYCKRQSAGFALLSTSRVYSIAPLASLKVEPVNDAFVPVDNGKLPPGITRAGVSERFSTSPPVSLYGSTKVASEHLALEYGATFNFPVWINRCGVMAGAGQFGHPAQGIFAFWIHSFREGRPLSYIGFGGEGYQVRDCLHPRDLVPLIRQQIAEPLETTRPRTVNLSGGVANSMSLRQLSLWCERRYSPKPIAAVAATRPFDIPWMVLDPSLAGSVWSWRPQTTLEQVLQEISDHANDHPDWLARCS